MKHKTITLIGFSKTGKTTLGRLLSQSLNYTFWDTDSLIEELCPPLSCREIFRSKGAEYFRFLERQAVDQLSWQTPAILATGGGTVSQLELAAKLKDHSRLIYLHTSLDILKARIWSQSSLPAYLEHSQNPEEALAQLYFQREKDYQKWADVVICMNGLAIQESLESIIHHLNR